ncbi:MAG TPA: sigma-70 family RNA polymerase sigma factor [Bacteroidales bacterium]|nr:sigma-70 family RNA polymerase sigma factor [Bacteroidales bacterium]
MRSGSFSDNDLINGLIQQDEKILKEFYRLFFQGIRRLVISNSGSEADAQDLFQDALLVMFQKSRQNKLVLTCSVGTYLYSVSRYLWLKELNRRKWVVRVTENEDIIDLDGDISTIHEKNERLLFYQNCFEKLSSDCRKVLDLFSQGLSIAQITNQMGYKTEQHTKNRRYRCKLTLINSIRSAYDHHLINHANHQTD